MIQHQIGMLLLGPRRPLDGPEKWLQGMLNNERMMAGGLIVGTAALAALFLIGLLSASWAVENRLGLRAIGAVALLGSLTTLGGLLLRAVWLVGEKERALRQDEFGTVSPREETSRR